MVQTYQSPVRVYKYPFELVMAAYEKRFPTCPQIPIFVGSEIVSEFRSLDGAEEVVERKCQLNVEAPYLVKKIAGVDYVYFNQKNSLDRRKRTLLIEASNISFSSRVIVKENCFYYVHSENDQWTCFEQSASLDVKSFFGFEPAVEKLAVKQYAANLAKGKEVLEFFIDELIKNGVTSVPRWTPPEGELNTITANATNLSESSENSATNKEKDGEVANESANGELPTSKKSIDKTARHASESFKDSSSAKANADTKLAATRRRSSGSGLNSSNQVTRALSISHAPLHLSASFEDPDEKLETEYIHRVLGLLTPLEESRLCELKYGLRAAHKGKMPNDAHLLRFLRSRDFDVQKARDMLLASLLWRKQHNVDKILNDFVPPPVLLRYFPGRWHHHDLEDRPLFVLRLGQMDVKGILRAVGLEAVVKFTLSICEEGLLKATEATKRLGKPITTWTLLIDLEGLTFRHVWRPGVQSLLRIIETVEAHYPETMGLMLIARAPRVFPVLWTLVSPFINENTRKKFMINSNDAVITGLAKYIDKQYLPDFLGGPCVFEVTCPPDGWHVPKSEYQPVDFDILLRETEHHILTSMYTPGTVLRNNPHEVYVQVSKAGCVLTWDFDVIKGECDFVVYFSGKTIQQPIHVTSPSGTSSTLNPVEFVTAAIGATSFLSSSSGGQQQNAAAVIGADPELRLGHDLRIVEKSIPFAEGDSMQGSHYCSQTGTYILQWRAPDHHRNVSVEQQQASQQLSANSSVIENASTGVGLSIGGGSHKCKVMYYYEVLDSEGFRGSVQSLESCRSSFSSLSATAGHNTTSPNINANISNGAGGVLHHSKKQPQIDETIPENSVKTNNN